MKFILIIFALTLSFNSISQNILIKKNGEEIPYKKHNIYGKNVQLKLADKTSIIIPASKIAGTYSIDKDFFLYMKSLPLNDNLIWQFVAQINDGPIKIYQDVELASFVMHTGSGTTSTTTPKTIYYVEKDSEIYKSSKSGIFSSNKKLTNKLKKFVDTDSIALRKVNSHYFKNRIDQILEIVNIYNINAINKKNKAYSDSSKNNVIIQRNKSNQSKNDIQIKLNDTLISLNNWGEQEVLLSTSEPYKLCVSSGNIEKCTLIQASKYYRKIYEVGLSKWLDINIELLVPRK
ncbi:hypothetical protein GCM10011506_33080 [Marivirga lumbricoides]|uniref:DUF4369 domain-containing protein n=1 Tax=Marivirga lumbricoides TaxID=1046115 RepID=A0ABQ1MQT4_9BACT|nr:hypothetical protein GCM10011506_33080 [Marivirga lumbricoides]